jgi:hypothetical protein
MANTVASSRTLLSKCSGLLSVVTIVLVSRLLILAG